MKRFLYLFCFPLFLVSCLLGPDVPTLKEKEAVFKSARFDQKLIENFPKYDILAQFILKNLDTIIAYRNSKNIVGVIGANGKEKKMLQKEVCFEFFNGHDLYDIKNVPDFLSPELDSLCKVVGKNDFTVCAEKRPALLTMRFNFDKRENNVLEGHSLYWHLTDFDNHDSFSFVKDTALSSQCIYRVGITENHSGW